MKLSYSIAELKGVGDKVAEKFNRLGVYTIEDLLFHYPRRYDDYSKISKISDLGPGKYTIKGRITQVNSRRTYKKRLHITEAVIEDDSGSVSVVWFNQPYLSKQLPQDEEVYASGSLEFSSNRLSFMNPTIETVKSFTKDTARIIPIYPQTKGLSSKKIRKFITQALPLAKDLSDDIPEEVREKNELMTIDKAIEQVHFPKTQESLKQARYRIAFEELFVLMLSSLSIKDDVQTEPALKVEFKEKVAKDFVKKLPFDLTDAQRRSAWQIFQDMDSDSPMSRLLQGDVGSGKTVVAAMAAKMAIDNGYQVAFIAPTEVLAKQHHETLQELLGNADLRLLIGGVKNKDRQTDLEAIKSGEANLVVGTHALIQKDVAYKDLGLVIVDEQHRFGVSQRTELKQKADYLPHMLSMSATPIPRSLALTIYGDLDISVIDEMPKGRKPVETKVANYGTRKRIYQKIKDEISKGSQCFVVCPLISDSDTLGVKSVESEYEELNKSVFKKENIAMLHGKLKSEEKDKIIKDFATGDIDILISTTVVEVGVDIPNATVMLIEGAERFGLSQLHQLRGRVGRSDKQAYCYLLTTNSGRIPKRLRALEQYNSGFKLAEIDLQLRGPGEVYGLRQHGALDLRMAKITDTKLISKVRSEAEAFLQKHENLVKYPQLTKRINRVKSFTSLD